MKSFLRIQIGKERKYLWKKLDKIYEKTNNILMLQHSKNWIGLFGSEKNKIEFIVVQAHFDCDVIGTYKRISFEYKLTNLNVREKKHVKKK